MDPPDQSGPRSLNQTNRSDSGYASGRNSTASTTLKMAVFAPMPSASVSTATAVKPGFFSNWRKANLRSFMAQRLHRIEFCGAASRQPAGQQGHSRQGHRYSKKSQWIRRFYRVEQPRQISRQGKRPEQPDRHPGQRQPQSAADHKTEHITLLSAQGHPHTDLAPALRHRIRYHAVDA